MKLSLGGGEGAGGRAKLLNIVSNFFQTFPKHFSNKAVYLYSQLHFLPTESRRSVRLPRHGNGVAPRQVESVCPPILSAVFSILQIRQLWRQVCLNQPIRCLKTQTNKLLLNA